MGSVAPPGGTAGVAGARRLHERARGRGVRGAGRSAGGNVGGLADRAGGERRGSPLAAGGGSVERERSAARGADGAVDASTRLTGGQHGMTRIEGVDPRRLTDGYAAKVLEAQAKACGACGPGSKAPG